MAAIAVRSRTALVGDFPIIQASMVADNADGVVIKSAGHWLMDEEPKQAIPKLVAFFRG